jgi:hypothetical protein
LWKPGVIGNNPTDAARIIIAKHLEELDAQGKTKLFPEVGDADHGPKAQ